MQFSKLFKWSHPSRMILMQNPEKRGPNFMKVAFFDSHGFEQNVFKEENNKFHHEITFFETRLTEQSANLAAGFPCICAFVNDRLDRNTLQILSSSGSKLIALRSAGFNHVDLKAAQEFG